MKQKTTRKCLHCSEQFIPDPRNRERQCHCGKPECQKVSKAASQRRWTGKPENKNYFRGAENTDRVRQWRKANPGYRRKKKPAPVDVQQDSCDSQRAGVVDVVGLEAGGVLQDVCLVQPALLVGIIAMMTGHVQQEDIAASARSFLARGADILRMGRGECAVPES
jgi:hypothetical protein